MAWRQFGDDDWLLCPPRQALILNRHRSLARLILVLKRKPYTGILERAFRQHQDLKWVFGKHDLTKVNHCEVWSPKEVHNESFEEATFNQHGKPVNISSRSLFRGLAAPDCMDFLDYESFGTAQRTRSRRRWQRKWQRRRKPDAISKYRNDVVANCSTFDLFAPKGTVSKWHVDMHGFDTTATCEFRSKTLGPVSGHSTHRVQELGQELQACRWLQSTSLAVGRCPCGEGDILI
ncbi:hypothetical protein CONLIGDRAFT_686701 [Coniochaeta ligniaria NRRL 30616]|uniref:Uncharacterized protein n=1 Tax=Coniochaeta ligniaria NRRL 30616 TaxID=1408157 RepID=A0A1J7I6J6_9PEZI|nr:hypothetical protein CONLIGDRAFT_686701 [Coniochaeta ligniaria NRRL 30616]